MMKTNLAIGKFSTALTQHHYPLSYLSELLHFLELQQGSLDELTQKQEELLREVIQSISQQVPVEYIVGEAVFLERRFIVDRNVLIPRFDTETLVEKSVNIIKELQKPITIIDIGTGSGAIIVSIVKELTNFVNATYLAIDVSEKAIRVAKQNAKRHDVTNKIDFRVADTYPRDNSDKPLLPETEVVFIVSNPPYISDKFMDELPASVKNYEPDLALRLQGDFTEKLQSYINFLRDNKKTIYCAFEYSDSNTGHVIYRYATPLLGDLQELLSS